MAPEPPSHLLPAGVYSPGQILHGLVQQVLQGEGLQGPRVQRGLGRENLLLSREPLGDSEEAGGSHEAAAWLPQTTPPARPRGTAGPIQAWADLGL